MKSLHPSGRRLAVLAALALFLISTSAVAAPAARVEFAVGSVSVEAADGRVRALLKGGTVEEGETVNTNEGRAQLRFTDDGLISLHSQTVFRIDAYRWSGVTDGSERGFFRLIKGGLRTITGKLAKINKKAYQMSTIVATIGVRGTEYTAQSNGDLRGSVTEGQIEVCNAGGCLAVPAGQSYYVADAATKPILSDKQTNLAPPQPNQNRASSRDTAGAVTTADGPALHAGQPVGISGALTSTGDSLTSGLNSTTGGLIGAVDATGSGLISFTQGAAASLLGGTALQQPVQEVTGVAGSILTVTTSTLGATTARVVDSVGGVTTGTIATTNTTANGVTGTLTGTLNGALNGIAGSNGLLGILKPGY